MSEPVLIKRNFLIAFVVVLQTITPPLVATAALFIIAPLWGLILPAAALAVTLTLVFLVLVRPPRTLLSQLSWQPLLITGGVVGRWLLLLAVLAIIGSATGAISTYPGHAILCWMLLTPVVLVLATLGVSRIMRRAILSAVSSRKVIFAGYNSTSLNIARTLSSNTALRLHVEGFFDDRAADRLQLEPDARLIGKLSDLAGYVRDCAIDVIYIALPIRHVQRVLDLLDDLRDTTSSIYFIPDIFVFDLIQARSGELNGFPVVAMCETPFYGYRGLVKRLIDIGVSICLLVLTSPLLLLIALLVKLSSAGPVLFRQRRYGLDGQEIVVYKFRTMTVTEDGEHVRQASATDHRITPIGRLLRRYSLDELPQFVNVLQGRMSVVGPRPHAVAHNELYRKLIKGYMVRHKVLPGITGLAQINGARGETAKLEEMEQRVRHDLDYLRRWSPLLDLKIVLLTARRIFRDEKAY
jgi:putative colanic acid biosynthesis UDP-glucose lipid carrier transferase